MKQGYFVGVDLGSSAVKAVILAGDGTICHRLCRPTGLLLADTVAAVHEGVLSFLADEGDIVSAVSTGYGRHRVEWCSQTRSEITCHARGVHYYFPQALTVIDIGGQDNKVIHKDEKGHVSRFRMNTKCAAGTGSFLEEIAARARLDMGQLHHLAMSSNADQPVNSFCTVFAMTEVLKRIMGGENLSDIARGVYISVAERIRELYRAGNAEVVLTGGVIQNNPIMHELLLARLDREPLYPEYPQFTGALGAALFAMDMHDKMASSEVGALEGDA